MWIVGNVEELWDEEETSEILAHQRPRFGEIREDRCDGFVKSG